VVDMLLNFTAMEFVSQLDEVVFFLSDQGLFGKENETNIEKVMTTSYVVHSKSGRKTRLSLLLIVLLAMLGGWGVVIHKQQSGVYLCKSVYIQFSDDFVPALGTFSGVYDLRIGKGVFLPKYFTYIERRSEKAKLGYCNTLESWTLSFDDVDIDSADPCDWHAKSSETVSFDLTETASSEWSARQNSREVPLQFFRLICYDCDNNGDLPCSGRGSCEENACQCDDGFYGLQCEFEDPCNTLAIDEQFSGFLGTRDWSTKYNLLQIEDQTVDVYDHPVYINEYDEGLFDVIMFTGRRWVATYSDLLNLTSEAMTNKDPKQALYDYLMQFHAHFSDFQVAFISEPVDKDTPSDAVTPLAVEWFQADTKKSKMGIQIADANRALDMILLCSVCNDVTNPCRYDGSCVNGSCNCSVGSSGVLCQIPPIGNGRCDVFFNSARFNYDGGDCCESTCKSSQQYACGKDPTGLVDIGYNFCQEPPNTWIENSNQIISENGRFAALGKSVALSERGTVLAVGEPGSGLVHLYDKDGSEWITRGRPLEGPSGSNFGDQIVMSGGLKNAIGNPFTAVPITLAVQTSSTSYSSYSSHSRFFQRTFDVYNCQTEGCSKKIELVGSAIAISGNGRTIALSDGSFGSSIYELKNDNWTESGSEGISAKWTESGGKRKLQVFESHPSSFYVSLSQSGDTVAIGTLEYSGGSSSIGDLITSFTLTVQVYTTDSFPLVPRGSPIETASHLFGPTLDDVPKQSVVLSDDALVLAVSSKFYVNTTLPEQSGVQLYYWDGNDWIPRGDLLLNANIQESMSVDLSSDGSTVTFSTGKSTRVLKWDDASANYMQIGSDLTGGTPNSLSLSGDGSTLAVGLPSSENNNEGGTTTVYKFSSSGLQCSDGMMLFRLFLTTDNNGQETRWNLISQISGVVLLEGGPYGDFPFTTFMEEICLDAGDCAAFTIYDDGVDGNLDSPGSYSIFLDGEQIVEGNTLQRFERHNLGNCIGCPEEASNIRLTMNSTSPLDSTYWSLFASNGSKLKGGGPYLGQIVVEEFCFPNFTDDCMIFRVIGNNETSSCMVAGPSWFLKYSIYKDGEIVAAGNPFLKCPSGSQIGECASPPGPMSCDDGTVRLDMTVNLPDVVPPKGIQWSILSMCSGEALLSDGPYDILEYGMSFTKETCIPTTNACPVLLFADRTTRTTYTMNLNGEEVVSNVGGEGPQTNITTITKSEDACNCNESVCGENSDWLLIGIKETLVNPMHITTWSVVSCSGETLLEGRSSNFTGSNMMSIHEVCIPDDDSAILYSSGTADVYVMLNGETTFVDIFTGTDFQGRGISHAIQGRFCLPVDSFANDDEHEDSPSESGVTIELVVQDDPLENDGEDGNSTSDSVETIELVVHDDPLENDDGDEDSPSDSVGIVELVNPP